MGLKIADLLRWRTSVILTKQNGDPIIDEDSGEPVTVWVRVVGDEAAQNAFRAGRIASAKKRKEMRDPTSDDFLTAVEPIREATRAELLDILKTARTQNLSAEAASSVERPNELEIAEFAIDPDAPTLEEQEKLDDATSRQDLEYAKALNKYQLDRIAVIEAELETHTDEELREMCEQEVSDIAALSAFLIEMMEQKIWQATYLDKMCKVRAFSSVEEYRESDSFIKEQLMEVYTRLEVSPDEVKN